MTDQNGKMDDELKEKNVETAQELSEEELMEAGGGVCGIGGTVLIKPGLGMDRKNGILRVDEDTQSSAGMDRKSGVLRTDYMSGGKSKLRMPGKGEYC